MRRPPRDATDCKNRCIEILRDIEHVHNEACVEVHVGRHCIVILDFLIQELTSDTLNVRIEIVLFSAIFVKSQLLRFLLYDDCSWIGQGVNRMA